MSSLDEYTPFISSHGDTTNSSTDNNNNSNNKNRKNKNQENNSSNSKLTIIRQFLIPFGFSGIQFLQFVVTPAASFQFPSLLSTAVIVGCGCLSFLVQPLNGWISDQFQTKWGRRRNGVVFATIFLIIAMVILMNSTDLGYQFLDNPDSAQNPVSMSLSLFAFIMFFVGLYLYPVNVRALIIDIYPSEKQHRGHCMAAFWISLGSALAFLARYFNIEGAWGLSSSECTDFCASLRISLIIGTVVLLVSSCATIFAANENKFQNDRSPDNEKTDRFSIYIVILMNLFSTCAWFSFFLGMPAWISQGILEESYISKTSKSKSFLSLTCHSIVSMFTSLIMPLVTVKIDSKLIWILSQVSFTVFIIFLFTITNYWILLSVISVLGIPWSINLSYPYHLLGKLTPRKKIGIYLACLYCFETLGRLIGFGCSFIIPLFHHADIAFLGVGAFFALCSATLSIWINPTRIHLQSSIFDHKVLEIEDPYQEIQEKDFIVENNSVRVFRARYKGTDVAVKEIEINGKKVDEQKNEVKNLAQYRHPNIVQLMGIYVKEKGTNVVCLGLVTEYLENGSLYDKIKDLNWNQKLEILKGIANGMNYLHKHNVIHRDLKSPNVLLDDHFKPLICDFGAVARLEELNSNHDSRRVGTPGWIAPEVNDNAQRNSFNSDVYSFGVIMAELATHKHPNQIGNLREVKERCPYKYYELMSQCIIENEPCQRPKLDEILRNLDEIMEYRIVYTVLMEIVEEVLEV